MNWVAAASSVVGTSHVDAGTVCQDSFAFARVAGRLVMAVADGAGSASLSQVGSRLAVEQLVVELCLHEGPLESITEEHAKAWLATVRQNLEIRAKADGQLIRSYASTLLGAAIDDSGAYFLQLGDGGWIVRTEATVECATWPTSGEYVNETVFVTSTDATERFDHAYFPTVTAVLGFTDGIERLCLDFGKRCAHLPIVSKFFSFLKSSTAPSEVEGAIEQFLQSDLVNRKTDDDKTMLLAWKCDLDIDADR